MARRERAASRGGAQPGERPAERMDRGTRALVLALPVAFLAHDVGEDRGSDDLDRALLELVQRSPRAWWAGTSAATCCSRPSCAGRCRG